VAWLQRGWSTVDYVGIEAVFVRAFEIPNGRGWFSTKVIFTSDLNALESVFPRDHHAHRRTVLIWQRLAVHSEVSNASGFMASSMRKAFEIGQLNSREGAARHLPLIVIALEGLQTLL